MTRTDDDLKEAKYQWLRRNRGVIARIAAEHNVSHGKVRKSFFELTQSHDPRVLRSLTLAGAPGFERNRAA